MKRLVGKCHEFPSCLHLSLSGLPAVYPTGKSCKNSRTSAVGGPTLPWDSTRAYAL